MTDLVGKFSVLTCFKLGQWASCSWS